MVSKRVDEHKKGDNERTSDVGSSHAGNQMPYEVHHPAGNGISKQEEAQAEVSEETASSPLGAERRWAYRNVLGVGLSLVFNFTGFFGLQNLQSSINSDQGLGLASLAVLYFFFTFFGFLAPSIFKIFGTKYSLTVGLLCFLPFTLANFYPSWYTLIPAAVVSGIGSALVWGSANSHIVEVAVLVVPTPGEERSHLIGIFTGVFFFFIQLANIPGNLASSLILYPYNSLNRTTSSAEDSCQPSTGREFDELFLYILCAVYTLSVIMAVLFSGFMVSHLGTNERFFPCTQKFKVFFKMPVIELLKVMKNYKMLLIAPVSMFNGMELAFLFGSFTALVANCFGVFQVGFTVIPWGVTSGLMSVVYGKAVKYVPMLTIFFFGGVINVALLIFLLLWTPTSSYLAIFSFAVLWGAADGVWNTMTTSLTGILFSTQVQPAISALRIWLAIGFTLGFTITEVLDLHRRVWIMIAAVIVALICVLTIEIVTKFRFPCTNPAHSYPVNRVDSSDVQMKSLTQCK